MRFLIIFLLGLQIFFAQSNIQGTFTDQNNLEWAMLYKLQLGKQEYISNAEIRNGHFVLKLPKNAPSGMYRVIYQIKPQKYINVFFEGNSFAFDFNANNPLSATFKNSKSNGYYFDYLKKMSDLQTYLSNIQNNYFNANDLSLEILYNQNLEKKNRLEKEFLQKTKGLLAQDFIKATNPYNPQKICKNQLEYLKLIQENYFQNIHFNNKNLQHSSFLEDRIFEYIFQLNTTENKQQQELLYQKALKNVFKNPMSFAVKKTLLNILTEVFSQLKMGNLVDFLFENYYDKLPKKYQNTVYKNNLQKRNLIRKGVKVPDFHWKDTAGKKQHLYGLKNAEKYLIIFWSSECSHCKKQIPAVYEYMKKFPQVKVIAIGLEKKAKKWQKMIRKMKGWYHIYGAGKWQYPLAKIYNIHGTPKYLLLDKDKKLFILPQSFKKIRKFL